MQSEPSQAVLSCVLPPLSGVLSREQCTDCVPRSSDLSEQDTHVTNDFSIIIQNQWNLHFPPIPLSCSDCCQILHMARQLCCRAMCKIWYQYHNLQRIYIEPKFSLNLNYNRKVHWRNGPRPISNAIFHSPEFNWTFPSTWNSDWNLLVKRVQNVIFFKGPPHLNCQSLKRNLLQNIVLISFSIYLVVG